MLGSGSLLAANARELQGCDYLSTDLTARGFVDFSFYAPVDVGGSQWRNAHRMFRSCASTP